MSTELLERQAANAADIGARAGILAEAARRHFCNGADLAFDNTIFAVYGVASPQGRIVDRLHGDSLTFIHLRFEFWWLGVDYGRWSYDKDVEASAPSEAAQRMIDRGLRRGRGHKVPTTPAVDAALSAYLDERRDLLRQIETLFEDGHKATRRKSRDNAHYWAKVAAQDRKPLERLRAVLPGGSG